MVAGEIDNIATGEYITMEFSNIKFNSLLFVTCRPIAVFLFFLLANGLIDRISMVSGGTRSVFLRVLEVRHITILRHTSIRSATGPRPVTCLPVHTYTFYFGCKSTEWPDNATGTSGSRSHMCIVCMSTLDALT